MPGTNKYRKPRSLSRFLSHFLSRLQHIQASTCACTGAYTHMHRGLQVNYNVLIRLGVFVLAPNTTGANKAVQHLFVMLHLGVRAHVHVCLHVSVMAFVTPARMCTCVQIDN